MFKGSDYLCLMPVVVWLTLCVPRDIFHYRLSSCPLSFKGKIEDESIWDEKLFKTGKRFWVKETLEFLPLYLWIFFNMYLKEDYLKVLCCTRFLFYDYERKCPWNTVNLTQDSTSICLSFTLFGEKFLWRTSICLLCSRKSSDICRFFLVS